MKAARRMRVIFGVVMAVAVTAAGLPAAAAPKVLDQASTNAQVIVVIPNMKALSDKVARLQQALQIPSPEMADMLSEFKNQSGMINGLKDDGAAMIVISDLQRLINEEVDEPPMAVVMEVTDYAAFVGNYGGNAGDDVTTLTMPMGEDGFARKVGDFAVMGPNKDLIAAYAPANAAAKMIEQAGKLGAKYLASGDVVVYVDVQALAPALRPKLKEGFDEMMREMKASVPADQAGMIEGVFAIYFEAIDTILQDGQAGVMALDLSDDGVGSTYAFQAKPNSTMARYFPGGSSKTLLQALPNQPYLVAMGLDMKAIDFTTLFEKAMAKLPEDDAGWMAKLYKQAMPLTKLTNSTGFAWYAPPAGQMMMGPGMMNMVYVMDTTDGPGYLAATKAYMEGLNDLKMPMEELGVDPMTFATQYNAGAMNLEGVSVDQYSMKMQMPPELMQQLGPAAPMVMMMGGLGYDGLIGAKGNRVVMTTSVDALTMSGALQAADKADGLGTQAGIAGTKQAALPPGTAMEMHISVEGILNAVNPMVQMFAGQALPVPENMPPITSALGVEAGGVAGRLYLPIKTMQGIMEVVNTAQAAMGGGMDGDDGGAPPPF
jgi:hypothetical protein